MKNRGRMAQDESPQTTRSGWAAFVALVRDIAAFAGMRGIRAAVYIALGAVFESVGIVLIVSLLAVVIGGHSGGGTVQRLSQEAFAVFGVKTPFGRLALLLGGFVVLMILRGIVISARDNAVLGLQVDYIEDLRGRVTESLARSGWDQVLRLRHARVLNVLSNDIQRIASAAHYLLQALIALIILVAQAVLSFLLSPALSLIAIALLVVGAFAMVPTLRRARALGQFMTGANLSMLDSTSQFLNGLKLALSQDLQGSFVAEFRQTMRTMKERQRRYNRQTIRNRIGLSTGTALVGAAVVLIGFGYLELKPEILMGFLLVIGRMSAPATQIQQGFQLLANGLPAFESIEDLRSDLHEATPAAPSQQRPVPDGPIVFDGVSYHHAAGDGAQGVTALNLRILPGSFVGIAGASGAGKTTFADLLVGLLRPQAGRILVGGVALDDAMLTAWRTQLSYISQDPFLFHDSIRRNLLWARAEASEAEMWDALALAGADGIVRRMDGGLDGIVGERGSLVSGGERQRIALARALLRRPRLLVMDEATNAIDIAGERSLLERLLAIRPRMTIVMIAHRAESLALCDRLLTIEQGRIGEDTPALQVQPAG